MLVLIRLIFSFWFILFVKLVILGTYNQTWLIYSSTVQFVRS